MTRPSQDASASHADSSFFSEDKGSQVVEKKCRECERVFRLRVAVFDFKAWLGGALVQSAFPYLSSDDRELLVSGICGACFDQMFSEEED